MFDRVLNTLLCLSIHYNEYKQADGWLHFMKRFSTNTRIEQELTTQTFLETRNWKILSPKLPTRLITCLECVYRKTSKE